MKLKEYVQTDEFLGQPLDQRQQWLSKQQGWDKLPPEVQRQYLTGMGKADYKPRDLLSKAYGIGLPLAGQYGAEAAAGAGGLAGIPETGGASALAAAMGGVAAAGGAGATLGSAGADLIDYFRKMGPKPTLRSEARATPRRFAYGAAGSALGMANPRLVTGAKEGISGTLEALANNPRYYTRALLEGKTRGVPGTPEAIEQAAGKGEQAVAEFEAKAQNKIVDLKKEIKGHWRKKEYGDPVEGEFEDPGPEPRPEQFKTIDAYKQAALEWSRKANPPKPVATSLSSIYSRFMKLIREKGKAEPRAEVPELVRVKRLAQSKIDFDKMATDAKQKLTPEDLRRLGKITNQADKRIAELDPKQKELETKLSEAYGELEKRRSTNAVKTLGGRGYPGRFQERLGADVTRVPRTITGQTKSPAGERTMGELRNVEKETGTKFLDETTSNMAKNYYSKALPQGRQPWMRRMALSAPLLAAGYAMGNKPSSYMMSMLPLIMMMSPKLAATMLTSGARYGPEALSQFARSLTEKEPE
jgi:hypothetical protein